MKSCQPELGDRKPIKFNLKIQGFNTKTRTDRHNTPMVHTFPFEN
jgi:hypothetical protein